MDTNWETFSLDLNLRVRYGRDYGVYGYVLRNGETVTAVSQPGWETFSAALEALETTGEYVTTPELITFAPEIGRIAAQEEVTEGRIEEAKRWTTNFPESTLLLGSAVFDQPSPQPRNAVLFLQNGKETGRTYKMPHVGQAEATAFGQAQTIADSRLINAHTLPIICIDLQFHRLNPDFKFTMLPQDKTYVDPVAGRQTLLVASRWATPLLEDSPSMPKGDDRYLMQMERAVEELFSAYATLKDIVITDSLPPGLHDGSAPPINAHFQRTT